MKEKGKEKIVKIVLPNIVPELEWLYVPNVCYNPHAQVERTMQLVIPYRQVWEQDERFPVLLFVQGAAWREQEMYNALPALFRIAEQGIVVASVQVRGSGTAPFPAQLEDIRAAWDFLKKRVGDFHIAPDRLFLAGNSSGGHLVLMAALTKTVIGASGILAICPPTDLLHAVNEPQAPGIPEGFRPVETLLVGQSAKMFSGKKLLAVSSLKSAAAAASPLLQLAKYPELSENLPPVLLMHGTADDQVPVLHSRRLYRMLQKYHRECVYYEIEGAGHLTSAVFDGDTLEIIIQFIKKGIASKKSNGRFGKNALQ